MSPGGRPKYCVRWILSAVRLEEIHDGQDPEKG